MLNNVKAEVIVAVCVKTAELKGISDYKHTHLHFAIEVLEPPLLVLI